jgi:hypothetical protein
MRRELSLKRLTHAKKQALAQKALPAAPVSSPAALE